MSTSDLLSQLTGSSLVVWSIDYLKRSDKFPWLTKETEKLNQLAAAIGAAITAAGIHFVIEPTSVAGGYTIAISGLTFGAIWHFFISLASQQTILKVYQTVNVLRDIANRLPKEP